MYIYVCVTRHIEGANFAGGGNESNPQNIDAESSARVKANDIGNRPE
jgi:hypothetical protein